MLDLQIDTNNIPGYDKIDTSHGIPIYNAINIAKNEVQDYIHNLYKSIIDNLT